MKTFIKSIVFLLASYSLSFAQKDTTLKEYFPMEIGNVWEYEEDYFPWSWRYQVKIVGDTIMPNGKTYRVFIGSSQPEFYRIDDSLNVYRYKKNYFCIKDSEYIRFRLTAKDGSIWFNCVSADTHYVKLLGTRTEYYFNFGASYETKYYNEGIIRTMVNMTIRFAKGLGNVFSIFEGPPHVLVGAIINGKKIGDITSINQDIDNTQVPQTIEIKNYPNPFNSSTTITVQIDRGTNARLSIFNLLGQEVKRLTEGFLETGMHRFVWDGKSNENIISPSGVYFCLLQTNHTYNLRVINLIK